MHSPNPTKETADTVMRTVRFVYLNTARGARVVGYKSLMLEIVRHGAEDPLYFQHGATGWAGQQLLIIRT